MGFTIEESACIGCGACVGSCPVSAIVESNGKYKIEEDKCISCGACAGTCPVSAIKEG